MPVLGINNPTYQAPTAVAPASGGSSAPTTAPASSGVYWIGSDGNVYYKDASGVRNAGKPTNATAGGFDAQGISAQATRINDPNPGGHALGYSTTTPSTTATTADKSNDIALQTAGLGSVDSTRSAGLSSIDKALGLVTGQYDTEKNANETNYGVQSDTNKNNLQKNKQTALVNAAAGRQGLSGTLASIGALNGSGIELADRAVQNGANADLSGASDNFAENQSGLDTSIGTFRSEDDKRREDAATAAENAKTNVNNDAAKSRQAFYSNLANDFAAQGDATSAAHYSQLAADLFPTLSSTSIPNSNIAYSGAAFTPGTLASYMAGAGDTAVTTAPSTGAGTQPTLIATTKKKELQRV